MFKCLNFSHQSLTFGAITISIYFDMGGVPVKHHTSGKVGRRRSHLALRKINLAVCSHCRGPKLPHRTCGQCERKLKI